ncbi:MAG: hypothetical protein QM771_16215 [Nitrospira sp.]
MIFLFPFGSLPDRYKEEATQFGMQPEKAGVVYDHGTICLIEDCLPSMEEAE